MPEVRFDGLHIEAQPGRDLLGQLLDAGARIEYLCMAGSCRTCRVRVISGGEHLEPPCIAERIALPRGRDDMRLACQAIVRGTGDVEVAQDVPVP
jgi:ferredoxin